MPNIALRSNFLTQSRGFEILDTATVTWTFDKTTNQLTADVSVAAGSIADDAITNAKLANMAQATIKGRTAGAGTGDPVDLTAAQVKAILSLASTDISDFTEAAQDAALGVFANSGRITFVYNDASNSISADIATASLSNAYLADMAQSTIKGRASGAGSGVPTDLTSAQARTILSISNVEDTALSTWAGSANLTTLGTIGTGTWNATAIADGKIASALTGKTYNGLTLTSLATGFSLAGGATSKTLTVPLDATVSGTNTGDQSGANPSGLIGMTATNGSATTFLRSDSTHAIDPAIAPTWTGNHTFTPSSGNAIVVNNGSTSTSVKITNSASSDHTALELARTAGTASNWQLYMPSGSTDLRFYSGGDRILFGGGGGMTVKTPVSGDALTVLGSVRVDGQATTGAQTATFAATNKPGSGTTSPDKWIPVNLDGTVHYIPAFL